MKPIPTFFQIFRWSPADEKIVYRVVLSFLVIALFQFIMQVWGYKLTGSDLVWSVLGSLDKYILVLFSLYLIKKFLTGNITKPPFSVALLSIVAFFGFASLYQYSSRYPLGVLQFVLTFQGLLVLVICANFRFSERLLIKLLNTILVFGILVLLIGVLEVIAPNIHLDVFFHGEEYYVKGSVRSGLRTISSVFGKPVMFAWFMGFCFCLAFSFSVVTKQNFYLLLSLCFFVGLILAFRRRTIIAIIFAAIFILAYKGGSKDRLVHMMMAVLGIGVVGLLFSGPISSIIQEAMSEYMRGDTIFVHPRILLLNTSIDLANENFPFGTGLSTYGSYTSGISYSPVYYEEGFHRIWGFNPTQNYFITDTYWPMIFGEFGWIGALLVAAIWSQILLCIFRLRGNSVFSVIIQCCCASTLLQLIMESVTTPALSRSPQVIFVTLLIGLAISSQRNSH